MAAHRVSSSRATANACLALLCLTLPCVAPAQAPSRTIGSSNTVTADPPVLRPREKPCIVPLFMGLQFVDFSIKTFQFTPSAACPGPWHKIVFTGDFGVSAGRQFDRTAIVDLGHVNLYFGTTPEPSRNVARTWHVERDLTDYSALFGAAQTGSVILGNVVDSTYTGIITGSAQLEFYGGDEARERAADVVLPLTQPNGQGGVNEPAFLTAPADRLATTFTLPRNIERAYLDVIAQSQSNDEFWYTCVPDDVTAELQSCGSTAFRETEVSVDGQPAGFAPVYPWIYTGGLDPYLWRPIVGVQTLNFVPYRVDLTPFAGVLSDGQPHTVALAVFNADSYFAATATLLLYQDPDSDQVTGGYPTGGVTGPNPIVTENLAVAVDGTVSGSVTTTASREFVVVGGVVTSKGARTIEIHQRVNFSNVQNFVVGAASYTQDVSQATEVQSRTVEHRGASTWETRASFSYPLTLDYTFQVTPAGTATQSSTVRQEFKHEVATPSHSTAVDDVVAATDTLDFDASGNLSGNSGATSMQRYRSADSAAGDYDCMLTAVNNVLASISGGCNDGARH